MSDSRQRNEDIGWSQAPYVGVTGLCMGSADVVPGVSGGTMAFAMGIYAQLLAAINSINADAVRAALRLDAAAVLRIVHWRFMVSLVSGLGIAIAFMVKIVKLPELIASSPKPVYAVFFGLVLASALVLARRIPRWTAPRVVMMVVGIAIGFAVVNLVPVSTPDSPLFVFLCGVAAICAMVLPGISGSFVLLILGKYEHVLGAVSSLDLEVLVPFALGCALGITSFSRILSWLLYRYQQPMVAMLTGFLFGSLWRIWPYQVLETFVVHGKMRVIGATPFLPTTFEPSVWMLLALGLFIVVAIELAAARRLRSVGAVEVAAG